MFDGKHECRDDIVRLEESNVWKQPPASLRDQVEETAH